MQGHHDAARASYMRAWASREDAYDACVAAHYVARSQSTPEDSLAWNLESLSHASAVDTIRIRAFLPSLHLNVGHSYEQLGDVANARAHYALAHTYLDALPVGAYGDVVRQGIDAALRRIRP